MAERYTVSTPSLFDDMPQSTRLVRGGDLSGTLGGTTFNVAGGIGQVIDSATDPLNPTHINVTWPAQSNIPITNINTASYSWIGISSTGVVTQFPSKVTPQQLRSHIMVGILIHYDYATLIAVFKETATPAIDAAAALYDFSHFIAPISRGNQISANGANLKFNKASGKIFQIGINWFNDRANPNIQDTPAVTAQPFVYVFRDGIGGWKNIPSTDIVPGRFDDGTAVGSATIPNGLVNSNDYVIHTVFIGYGGIVIIRYGQVKYSSFALARDGLVTDVLTVNETFEGNLTIIGRIIVRGGATNLSLSTDALFAFEDSISII
jgi:hypothetical protein